MSIKSYVKRVFKYIIYGIPEYKLNLCVKEMSPNNVLEGRRILITGGSKGLGYYIAKRCVAEGADVLITGRDEDGLKSAIEKLQTSHVKYLVMDVRKISNFTDLFERAESILGGQIDSLVSNAGISLHEGDFRNVTESGWDNQFDTNLKGNYFLVQTFIKYLEKFDNKMGNIVVVSSERARRPDDLPYGLTKAATSSFVQAIARKVIEEGIRINGVAPGVTATDMTGFDREGNMYAEWQAGKRIFLPEEVAEVVNFLLSEASTAISGEVITCNLGNHIVPW